MADGMWHRRIPKSFLHLHFVIFYSHFCLCWGKFAWCVGESIVFSFNTRNGASKTPEFPHLPVTRCSSIRSQKSLTQLTNVPPLTPPPRSKIVPRYELPKLFSHASLALSSACSLADYGNFHSQKNLSQRKNGSEAVECNFLFIKPAEEIFFRLISRASSSAKWKCFFPQRFERERRWWRCCCRWQPSALFKNLLTTFYVNKNIDDNCIKHN